MELYNYIKNTDSQKNKKGILYNYIKVELPKGPDMKMKESDERWRWISNIINIASKEIIYSYLTRIRLKYPRLLILTNDIPVEDYPDKIAKSKYDTITNYSDILTEDILLKFPYKQLPFYYDWGNNFEKVNVKDGAYLIDLDSRDSIDFLDGLSGLYGITTTYSFIFYDNLDLNFKEIYVNLKNANNCLDLDKRILLDAKIIIRTTDPFMYDLITLNENYNRLKENLIL